MTGLRLVRLRTAFAMMSAAMFVARIQLERLNDRLDPRPLRDRPDSWA